MIISINFCIFRSFKGDWSEFKCMEEKAERAKWQICRTVPKRKSAHCSYQEQETENEYQHLFQGAVQRSHVNIHCPDDVQLVSPGKPLYSLRGRQLGCWSKKGMLCKLWMRNVLPLTFLFFSNIQINIILLLQLFLFNPFILYIYILSNS